MFSFLKKLLRNKRGNTLAIAAASMPLFIGAAGLANDTIQWTLWKRQLQRAADSAAIAGVYDREAENGGTTNAGAAVARDLSINLHTFYSLQTGKANCSGTCTISYPADSGVVSNQVSVTIAIQQPLSFSSFFLSTAPTITATATAGSIVAGGSACIEALESSASATGITNSGNTTVNAPTCILYSNSPSSNSASAGGSSAVTAKAIAAVGGIQQSNNWTVQQYIPYSPPLADPFANVNVDTTQMHGCTSALDENTNLSASKLGTTNCFTSLSTKPSGSIDLTGTPLDGQTIYISGGSVDLKGSFKCTCTIVLTNINTSATATIGTWTSNAQATNNIVAPTTGNYKGIAVYQDRRATGNTDKINGGSSNVIQGAVYFPKDTLQINGTGSSVSLCAMWVAKDVVLTGTSSIAISSPDDASCSGSGLPSNKAVKMVRLVA